MSLKTTAEKSKTIVIKIGTNILTTPKGTLDLNNLRDLISQISHQISKHKKEIIIVTSGAIICGAESLNLTAKTIPEKQAAASVGQILLMGEYLNFFWQKGIQIGQILLTKESLEHPTLHKNAYTTIAMLLKKGIVPIINENDSVATDEIGNTRFGDNDQLSFLVSKLTHANMLIMLTDIDGLHTKNPKNNKDAKLISELDQITDDIINKIDDNPSHRSRGGMKSKLINAKKATENGISVVIASGYQKNIIQDIFTGKKVGTFIKAQ